MAGSAAATLGELEAKLSAYNLRGQWQADANRPQNVRKGANGAVHIEPKSSGKAHVWHWADLVPILEYACEAMPESYTARRSLVLTNPGLQRGTTHTLLTGFQIVRPGEVAWAHRHTINALRFSIQGGAEVYTVVEGRRLAMEPYDLLLTPGWTWHDHHNGGDRNAIWLDGLDVPFTLALNQNFFDELGEVSQDVNDFDSFASLTMRTGQERTTGGTRPYRYPWADTKRLIGAHADDSVDPYTGRTFEFVNPLTGGGVLPTIGCHIQVLPPGFEGRLRRSTSSSTFFVIGGEGRLALQDAELEWGKHDSFVVPNWTWHRLVNSSRRESAVLFSMNDRPILDAFGLYREEREDRSSASQAPANTFVRPAAE